MMQIRWPVAVALLMGSAATAQQPPLQSRSPLGEAIRNALIATPEVLPPASGLTRAPLDLYGDDIARDLDALRRAAPRLFSADQPGLGPKGTPTRIALFTRADCPDCATAMQELQALATRMGFRVALFDLARDAALARDLGLDTAPFYVMPDRMLRGLMPAIVLERYLSE
ncbi:hypothetical protein ABIE58_002548 [Roseovarius sp. MBR-78]|uniref:hypothetical protein n=1 Tax=Roseovarius sp. MBR-78 TaxID=3156460 RepID=UPI00339084C5